MNKRLKLHYFIMVVPAVALLLTIGLAKEWNLINIGRFTVPSFVHSLVFILAAATAIAGPIFIRTWFAHSRSAEHNVSTAEFLFFQRQLLSTSQVTPYLAVVALFCDFPRFYATAIFLMTLYAVYYFFPSQKRIDFDRKIFRVK